MGRTENIVSEAKTFITQLLGIAATRWTGERREKIDDFKKNQRDLNM